MSGGVQYLEKSVWGGMSGIGLVGLGLWELVFLRGQYLGKTSVFVCVSI